MQLTLITLFLFFQSAIFFLTLFLFHNSPTQDTYSYFSNYLWKSSTPAEPEKRVVVSYAFDKYDYKDFETRNCLIITYENGFHIWDIEDTKNIFEICSIKSEEKKKYFYSKILPTPFNEIKGQPKNIFSSMRPVLLSYDGEGFLSWTSLSTKHEESRKSHQKISGIDANRHVICIVSSSFFFCKLKYFHYFFHSFYLDFIVGFAYLFFCFYNWDFQPIFLGRIIFCLILFKCYF